MLLSKSNYLSFSQCVKKLWLEKNRKDLLPTEIDPMKQKVFAEAEEIELLAIQMFPGITQAYDGDFWHAFDKTKKLIDQGDKTLYQPSFKSGGLFCRSDIIAQAEDGRWDVYEVKSSTQVKDVHLLDLAFQRIVLEDCGLPVRKLLVIHVDNSYVRQGKVDPEKMLKTVDVTEGVEAVAASVYENLGSATEVMGNSDEPEIPVLNQCYRPYECPFIGYCWKDIPKHSIHDLGLDETQMAELLESGIIRAEDVPDETVTEQRKSLYLKALKSGQPIIDMEEIGRWLDGLKYPLYFLDYETYASAIPMFDGFRPYQNMPVQYSLHVQDSPDSEVRHFEYLATEWGDPVPELAKSLKERIGSDGSVLVWYQNFEKSCNEEMGNHVPELREFFESVNSRVMDLMVPFKSSWYVDGRFGGSSSLKAVLPVLAPDLSYSNLEIGNGAEATVAWRRMVDRNTDPEESAKIRKNLLKYCDQDTLAMVRILDVLMRKI